ncbi:transmembrane protease serine 11C isoform X2 [Pelodiscus sinensis]|uniref:transmembrane protease serine 11C isoform X2 n=1 Tax=Pelodiscus sinensis TaxID=13735 RepID=UPI003F6CA79B
MGPAKITQTPRKSLHAKRSYGRRLVSTALYVLCAEIVHQSATKKRFFTPWKSTGIAVAGALGLAIAIGLLVYFLAYDQRPFYYNGNFKVTDVRYSDDLARKSSGAFREQSRRVERLIDKAFQSSVLRKKYIGSRVIRLSPDTSGVVAQVVLTFLSCATDSPAVLQRKVDIILLQKLNKYSGPVQIDFASSTLSDMKPEKAETLFNDFCGLRPNRSKSASTSNRVVGGASSAQLGDWPWQASLQQNNIHHCGATLISNTWLVSAAHCFRHSKNPHAWTVTFGNLLRPPRMKRSVKAIIVHEKYQYPAPKHDIAVVKLSEHVDFTSSVHRICLPDPAQIFPYNSDAVVTGWGAQKGEVQNLNVLQEATVKLIDTDTCNREEVYHGLVAPGMLCAGYLQGGVDACQGDSGGPLVSPDSRGMWYLVGIVSWGEECGKPNKPGVYTRVTYYRDWITSITGL